MTALVSRCQEPHFNFTFPSLSSHNKKPFFFYPQKCLLKPQSTIFNSLTVSCCTNSGASYNGWDDLRFRVDSPELGESNHIKKFLILLGIDDKKYVFTCMLGFFCALAISRVRVSSLVFPATAIVFAIGFSLGFVNGKPRKGFGFNGLKKRVKDESLRVYVEKLKTLVDLFDGLDVKVTELRSEIKKAIDYEAVEVGDLEGYVATVDSIDGWVLNARSVVEDCIDIVSVEGQEVGNNLIKKQSRRNKGVQNNGFGLFDFVGGFVRGNAAAGSKLSKSNPVRRDSMSKDVSNGAREDLRGSTVEKRPVSIKNAVDLLKGRSSDAHRKTKLDDVDLKMARDLPIGEVDSVEAYMRTKTFRYDGGFYRNLRFMNTQRVGINVSAYKEIRRWAADDRMSSNDEFDLNEKHLESKILSRHQEILRESSGAYEYSEAKANTNYENYRAKFREEKNVEDELRSRKYQSQQQNARDSFSSSTVSDDVLFDKCLKNANDLLKRAKECLKIKNDEMLAEEMLLECTKLLSQAIAMKPMSLLAMGQLGNTYLLHGELKLRISRELRRRFLSRTVDFRVERQSNLLNPLDKTLPSTDRIADLLVIVCEECETLLVEAGRKYRTALAIDGNDLRALYNWGLALFFRAQLIADIGPETAFDADKLFLAAIDKFDAMMSRSNAYAPEALFRWGVALQQRSRLRPSNSLDKVKLLEQAKTLYEDALDMGSDNVQIREALASCISELDFSEP